jgi:hypothetical protein
MKFAWNGDLIEERLQTAWNDYLDVLAGQFQREITTRQFDWPNPVRRGAKGQFTVNPPLNIVDTGQFRNSQRRYDLGPYRALFVWQTEYSAAILYGYRTTSGKRTPPRDWITPALAKRPLQQTIERLL